MLRSPIARSSTYANKFGRCIGRIPGPEGDIYVRDPHMLLQPFRTNAQRARAVYEAIRAVREFGPEITVLVDMNYITKRPMPRKKQWGLPNFNWQRDSLGEKETVSHKEVIRIVIRRNHLERTAVVISVKPMTAPTAAATTNAKRPSHGRLADLRLLDPRQQLERLFGDAPEELEVAGRYPGELLLIATAGNRRHAFAAAVNGRNAVIIAPLCAA